MSILRSDHGGAPAGIAGDARSLPRPRLRAALDAIWAHPLTLLSAPAGFGKTVAVRDWLQARAPRAAWVALGPEAADPRVCWAALAAALDELWPGAGAPARGLLRAPDLPAPADVGALLLAGLADHAPAAPAVLILDDYQHVADPRSHAALRLLIERLPPWLRLVIITRHDPPLPLARLRAHGAMAELRAADLHLSAAEAAALLDRLAGRALPADLVAALHARTEGWVAALQLAALTLRQHPDPAAFVQAFSGSHRHMMAYLMDEVFAGLPAATQGFLLRTAILDRLCAPLCAALLDVDADCAAMLADLERQNLFLTPLDDMGRWFRWHPLVAEMLRQQLALRAPALPAALHRRAAAWHEGAGDLGRAYEHLRQAGDAAALADFVERHGRALIGRSQTIQLRRWLDQVPTDLVERRPLLGIWAAWLELLSGRVAAAQQLLGRLPAPEGPAARRAEGERLALEGTLARYRGDVTATLALGARARAALPDDRGVRVATALNAGLALLAAGDDDAGMAQLEAAVAAAGADAGAYGGLIALHAQARLALRRGRPAQALAICARGEQLAALWGGADLPAHGALLVCAAEAHALTGDDAAATAALDRAEPLLGGTIELGPAARAAALRAWLNPARPGLAARITPIDRALAWLDTMGAAAPHSRAWLAAQRARLALAHGALAAAQAWSAGSPADDPETAATQRLVQAQVALAGHAAGPAAADLGALDATLAGLAADLARRGWLPLQAEALLLRAAAAGLRGEEPAATDWLAQAIMLAAPEGLLRPLAAAALGLPLQAPLATAAQRWARRPGHADLAALAARLGERLPAATAPAPDLPPPALLAEPLSPREHEILQLIAAGLSNQAIADRLIVALNTVKWYSSEIYAKLGVRSRTQALIRARALGLLA